LKPEKLYKTAVDDVIRGNRRITLVKLY